MPTLTHLARLDRELYSPEALAAIAAAHQVITDAERAAELVPALATKHGRAKLYADLSSNNAAPDLAAYAAAGHKRISLKATEGVGYTWFAGNTLHAAAHRHSLGVERYGWLRPEYSPIEQADYFLDAIGAYMRRDDDWCCDFERSYNYSTGHPVPETDAERADQLTKFMRRVASKAPAAWRGEGRVYTGNWYLAELGPASQAAIRRFPVVMSDYSGVATLPNPYSLDYVAWQFTDHATVPGIAGTVDYNRLLVSPTPPTEEEITMRMRRSALAKFVNSRVAHAIAAGPRKRLNIQSQRLAAHEKQISDAHAQLAAVKAELAKIRKGQA